MDNDCQRKLHLWRTLQSWMNDLGLNRKLVLLYCLGILLPLVIIDGLFGWKIYQAEETRRQNTMEAEAAAIEYNMTLMLRNAFLLSQNFRTNAFLGQFLAQEYATPYSYLKAYQSFVHESFLDSLGGIDSTTFQIYADNDTIISGGYFHTLSSVENARWMNLFQESGENLMLLFYFDDDKTYVPVRRRVMLLSRIKSALGIKKEQVLRVNVDYSGMSRTLVAQSHEFPFYICDEDRILFTNTEVNLLDKDFPRLTGQESFAFEKPMVLHGKYLRILFAQKDTILASVLKENALLFLTLLCLSFLLPTVLIRLVGGSIRVRIQILADVFTKVESGTLTELPETRDKDEIGSLMQDYNRMAKRMNSLIETVYKTRLREQEMDIARQKAELLALHSQINPHFLFNALESIRMHSLLRQEYDTAKMMEMVARIQRQAVDWSSDVITIREEVVFLEAYLQLQRLRFEDRIRFDLKTGDCEDYLIPKLTLVTFVENSCVHSLSDSSVPVWIFVRIWEAENLLYLEVEDTGCGMPEEKVLQMNQDMNGADIQMLHKRKHVGIINACLRLKMIMEGKVRFEMESEEGVGTIVHIEIPKKKGTEGRVKGNDY